MRRTSYQSGAFILASITHVVNYNYGIYWWHSTSISVNLSVVLIYFPPSSSVERCHIVITRAVRTQFVNSPADVANLILTYIHHLAHSVFERSCRLGDQVVSISSATWLQWQDHPPQLPAVIHQEVMDYVAGFPISLEEAKTLRLKLMDERNAFVARHDGKFAEATFNLCEHWFPFCLFHGRDGIVP